MIITCRDQLRVQPKMIHMVWYEIYAVSESSSDPQYMQYKPKKRIAHERSNQIRSKRNDVISIINKATRQTVSAF